MNEMNINKGICDELNKYQTDHLFLLIGTNPLPNYVAYHLLAKPSSYIYLVHTIESSRIADRLIKVLDILDNHCKIIVDESEPIKIFDRIYDEAKGKQNIGLHYTGGTKAMAINAYNAIKKANSNSVYSYLSARNLKLVLNVGDSESKSFQVRFCVHPTLKKLHELHCLKVKDLKEEPFKPEFCEALSKVPCKSITKWCNDNLRYLSGSKMLREHGLLEVELPLDSPFENLSTSWGKCRTLEDLLDVWSDEFSNATELAQWIDGNRNIGCPSRVLSQKECNQETNYPMIEEVYDSLLSIPYKNYRKWCRDSLYIQKSTSFPDKEESKLIRLPTKSPFDSLIPFWEGCETLGDLAIKWNVEVGILVDWFNGKWLEDHTLSAIKKVSNFCEIHSYAKNVEIINSGKTKSEKKGKQNDFEFDVAALRGYQLFAVSCSTSSDNWGLKQKLFEAYVRGQQLGGDEAKIGLVCFSSDPNTIQKEIEKEWHEKDKFRVFGAGSIPKLDEELAKWLSGSS